MKLAKIIILFYAAITAGLATELHEPCIKWSRSDSRLQITDKFERSNASSVLVEVNVSPSDAQVPHQSLIVVVKAVGNYSNGKVEEIGTWTATASHLYSAMSPVLFDALTLGALDVSERYNRVLYVEFTTPICEGSAPDVMEGVVQSILDKARIDSKSKWTIQQYNQTVTLHSSQVFLFMATGLIAVFTTFITVPFISLVFIHTCQCCKKINTDQNAHLKTAVVVSLCTVAAMLDLAILIYWGVMACYYYRFDDISRVLFPDALLSPFSVALIFYSLTALTTFMGGVCFSKCSLSNYSKCSLLLKLGLGLASVTLSAGVFHSFYVVLAFVQDVVTVTSYLIVLSTMLLLLFLSIASIAYQYQKTHLKGFFALVIALKFIIFAIYLISVHAFKKLLLENCLTATKAWLVIVTLLSVFALSFSVSIFALLIKQPNAAKEKQRDGNTSESDNRRAADAESGRNTCKELVPKKLALTQSREIELVMLLPAVVETWNRRVIMKGEKREEPERQTHTEEI